jgi:hypothetical protein
MMSVKRGLGSCPTCACTEDLEPRETTSEEDEVKWEDVEASINHVFDKAEDMSIDQIEFRRVVNLHKDKTGIQNISIAHTKIKKSFVGKSLKDMNIPLKHPKVTGPK